MGSGDHPLYCFVGFRGGSERGFELNLAFRIGASLSLLLMARASKLKSCQSRKMKDVGGRVEDVVEG